MPRPQGPAGPGAFPYDRPPITAYGLNDFGVSSCPGSNVALETVRFGGECVACGSGKAEITPQGNCTCPDTVLVPLLGQVACGRSISSDGSAINADMLSVSLCAQYTQQEQWLQEALPARTVARLLLKAFTFQASPLLDVSQVEAANTTFYEQHVFDDRFPSSPTRKYGLKPNCNKCKDGLFNNTFSGSRATPVYDTHFDAMNTFRLIGYILSSVLQSPCPALWDPANPNQWKYGPYKDLLCTAIPP